MQPQYAYQTAPMNMPMMAEGGLAAAAQTQSKGRGGDTMLVHMSPGEVRGLQDLAMAHGGSLTINPDTGLPEAGFLKKILPMIAGAALAPFTGGLSAALLVGAGYTAATGSLKKGLMAGLGAYGGAGLMGGLTAAGAGTAAAGAAETAAAGAGGAGEAAMATGPFDMAGTGVTGSGAMGVDAAAGLPGTVTPQAAMTTTPAYQEALATTGSPDVAARTAQMSAQVNPVATPVPAITPPAPTPTGPFEASGTGTGVDAQLGYGPKAEFTSGEQFDAAGRGLKNVMSMGPEGTAARSAFMQGLPTGTLPAAGMTLTSALTPEPEKPATSPAYEYDYQYDWNKQAGAFNPPASSGAGSAERQYFAPTYTLLEKKRITAAGGGLMGLSQGGYSFDRQDDEQGYAEGGYKRPKARSMTGEDFYKFAQDRRDSSMEASIEQNFAKGGLGAASEKLPPRFLEGAGDGMSDSIKARIGGMQEARLADGEFVVPADVVSHLGNGSSKAGAKKLYAMMDKIRKARTGRERQAPEVNANKYMPA